MINLRKNDVIDVVIEKMVYGGDGLARFGEDNFVIFIKDSVVDDKLKVKITSINKKFARAEIIDIINPSPYRVKPLCPIYNACGSCQNQNYDYKELINQKTNVLKDIFNGIIDENKIYPVIKSPVLEGYRHKVQYPCRETKNSKRILMGYFKQGSHDITNIKYCPLQPKVVNEIAQFIRDNWLFGCYSEKTDKGLLKNVLIRLNSDDNEALITFVINSKKSIDLGDFPIQLKERFKIIKGIFINLNPDKTNKILGDTTIKISGDDNIKENLGDVTYNIGATSFFQVNPKGAEIIFDLIKDKINNNSTILDAYGGVGAIGIYLKQKASKITLVEENENAISMAENNFKINNVKNYEIFKGDAKKHFINFKNENRSFDYVILDPPRSGCDIEGLDAISPLTNQIIYVSCNPQTLKRDIIYLKEKGFMPEFIQGIDLFPYTYHIECITILKKEV